MKESSSDRRWPAQDSGGRKEDEDFSVSMQEKNLQGETEPFQLEYNLISIFLFCTYLQINTLKGSLREVSDLMFLKWDQTKELFC